MKLNKLSYQTEEEKNTRSPKLWCELLIDGESIEKFVGEDKAIPHYYFEGNENELPYYVNYQSKKLHLLGVCICGDSGCGSTDCEIEKDQDYVELKVFYPSGGYQPPEEIKFRFARENYDSVISEIRRQAKEYKEAKENK